MRFRCKNFAHKKMYIIDNLYILFHVKMVAFHLYILIIININTKGNYVLKI